MDNFTKVPNEILEAYPFMDLTKTQARVFWYLVRKIYGWHKERDYISISKMAIDLHRNRRNIQRAVNDLVSMGMIEADKENTGSIAMMRILPPDNWDRPACESTRGASNETHASIRTQGGASNETQGGASIRTHVPASIQTHTKESKETSKETSKESAFGEFSLSELERLRAEGWS
jgi:phage replication O-like protein O